MSYTSCVLDNLLVIKWIKPDLPDVNALEREVEEFGRGHADECYAVAVVPVETSLPSDQMRAAMGRSMKNLLQHVAKIWVVIEGDGFKHTALRMVMSGVLLVGGERGRVMVCRTTTEAFTAVAMETARGASTIERRVAASGVLG